jgi:hypothetical protein
MRAIASVGSTAVLTVMLCAASGAQTATLTSTWAAPDLVPSSYAGKKVAALTISQDMSLRMSSEEALSREISARGPEGIAAYRIIPPQVLEDKDKAQEWFTQRGIALVIAMRPISVDKEEAPPRLWYSTSYYQSFGTYYMNGIQSTTALGGGKENTIIVVETMLYDVEHGGKLIWAGRSSTTNPKNAGTFVQGLSKAVVEDLRKRGLVKK